MQSSENKTPMIRQRSSSQTMLSGPLTFVLSFPEDDRQPATVVSLEQGPTLDRLAAFTNAALRSAIVERMKDGLWYAEIPSCKGVWASSSEPGPCLEELREVLLDWLVLKLSSKDGNIPVLEKIDLNQA